jgi:hypothetical protein
MTLGGAVTGTLAACVLVAVPIPTIQAQDTTQLAAGDAVRVTAPSRHWKSWTGYFAGFRADSVVLRSAASPESLYVLPVSAVKRLDVNHGNQPARSRTWEGLAGGAAFGLAWGIATEVLYGCDTDAWICDEGSVITALTLGGAAIGGIAGALTHTPPYRTVQLQPHPPHGE